MVINKRARRDATQLYRLCLVDGLLDENRVRLAVNHVAAASGRNRLAILAHFLRLVRLDRAQHSANVESAVPLPEDLEASVRSNLAGRYGPGLFTTFVHRPSLIGGMRIQVGSDVYDSSVEAKLEALARTF